jgi:TRAP-type C4-dicarboxylate transport system substrate-binding protein
MHLNYPAGNFQSEGAQRFADRVKAATNGELEIVLHPGAALGFKGPELLRAVSERQLAIAEVPNGIAARKMPFSEVYPAMKAGLLDSMYTSSVSGVDAKAWEVLKYFTPINIVGPVNMVNVNMDAWNKLHATIQNSVLEIAAEMEDEMWNLAGDMDRKSRSKLQENGMMVDPVNQAFRKDLNEIGGQLRKTWSEKAGQDAQNILMEYSRITGR